MYEFPLSKTQNSIIKSWLSKKDKPLFITGVDGCGKSTLATQILKDYHIVHINSDFIKYSGDIKDYIHNSLSKKDILMMCTTQHYKSLLIDDLQLFLKYNKSFIKFLYTYLKSFVYSSNPILVICNNETNKYIELLQSISYNIELNYNQKKDNLHINKLKSQGFDDNTDKNYNINELLEIVFKRDISLLDIFRIFSSENTVLSLNILENTPHNIYKDYLQTIYNIYESICIGDYCESKYLDKCIDGETIILFSCVIPHIFIKYSKYNDNHKYKYKYNSYIGRSLIQINNQNLLSHNSDKITIDYMKILCELYKYISELHISNLDIHTHKMITLDHFNCKTLEKQLKVFNYYYNKMLTRKQLNKILSIIINEKESTQKSTQKS